MIKHTCSKIKSLYLIINKQYKLLEKYCYCLYTNPSLQKQKFMALCFNSLLIMHPLLIIRYIIIINVSVKPTKELYTY